MLSFLVRPTGAIGGKHMTARYLARYLAWPLVSATLSFAGGVDAGTTAKAERFVLEIGGARVEADEAIVNEKLGERDPLVQKATGGGQEGITLRGGAAMAKDVSKLLDEAFTKECARRVDGSLVFADKDYVELSRLTFSWGVVTEVSLPALDAKARDAASVTLKVQPQYPRRIVQHAEKVTRPATGTAWSRSSFKLSIDGLDGALKSVKEVGELRVAQVPNASNPIQCATTTISDLTFTIPSTDAGGLAAWKDRAAVRGSLDYLAADGAVMKVRLNGLKKKSITTDGALTKVTASVDAVVFGQAASSKASSPPGAPPAK